MTRFVHPSGPFDPQIPVDAEGRLAQDAPCVHCGYNLRGLSPEGACPECGTAVGRSVRGDFLRYCDPAWVGTMASGMTWIVAGILAVVAVAAVGMIVATALAAAAPAAPGAAPQALRGLDRWAPVLVILVAGTQVIGVVGRWKLTTPDPAKASRSSVLDSRFIARYTQIGTFGLSAVGVTALLARIEPLLTGQTIAAGLLAVVDVIAIGVYTQGLAARVPDPNLQGQTRLVTWGLAITLALQALVTALQGVSGNAAPATQPQMDLLTSLTCAVGLGTTAFGIWALILIFRYRRVLHEQAAQARATWAAAPHKPPTCATG